MRQFQTLFRRRLIGQGKQALPFLPHILARAANQLMTSSASLNSTEFTLTNSHDENVKDGDFSALFIALGHLGGVNTIALHMLAQLRDGIVTCPNDRSLEYF